MSLQSQVNEALTIKPGLTLKKLHQLYPEANTNTLRSAYNRFLKKRNSCTFDASDAYSDRITMDLVENLIIKGKTPIPLLRVMTDFLKVKSQDHSELQEIDLSIFYKKAMED